MSRQQQAFILDHRDLERARSAAITAGVSLNAWMRRAVRAALDGPVPTTQASVGALDTSALDAIAQRLGEQINDLARVGSGFRKIEDRLARGQALPMAAGTATQAGAATGARPA
jgi:hypothetical protein